MSQALDQEVASLNALKMAQGPIKLGVDKILEVTLRECNSWGIPYHSISVWHTWGIPYYVYSLSQPKDRLNVNS